MPLQRMAADERVGKDAQLEPQRLEFGEGLLDRRLGRGDFGQRLVPQPCKISPLISIEPNPPFDTDASQ